jgi:hypothetical protein
MMKPMHNLFNEKFKNLTDEELISGTAHGNDLQYAELMRRYMRSVFMFACQYATPEEAERITAQTFYTFWKTTGRLRREKKYRRQLFDIARSLATGTLLEAPRVTTKTLPQYILTHINLLELSDRLRNPVESAKVLALEIKNRVLPVIQPILVRISDKFASLPHLKLPQPKLKLRVLFNPYRI